MSDRSDPQSSAAPRIGPSFFSRRQKPLAIAAATWTVLLILSHWQVPAAFVWWVAALFSVTMNATYLIEARSRRANAGVELAVAALLVCLSLLGPLLWPPFVIAAVAGHGAWDVAKHYGAGVPFLSWYTWSCAGVDLVYAAALLAYWIG